MCGSDKLLVSLLSGRQYVRWNYVTKSWTRSFQLLLLLCRPIDVWVKVCVRAISQETLLKN